MYTHAKRVKALTGPYMRPLFSGWWHIYGYLPIYGNIKNIKENTKKVLLYYAKRATIRAGKKINGLNSESLEATDYLLTTKRNRNK